jgi:hypothetical protein
VTTAGGGSIPRQALTPTLIVVLAAVCTGVAATLDRPVWAAAVGVALVAAYWALEELAWRRGVRGDFADAVAVALGGMVLRLAAVLGGLVVVALVARPAFATAALSFLAAFTVYLPFRLLLLSGAAGPREAKGS